MAVDIGYMHLTDRVGVVVLVVVLITFLGILIVRDLRTPEWSDETVEIKLAQGFPNYSLSSNWVRDYPFYNTASRNLVELEYTMPVWHHPPLETLILIPFVSWTSDIYILRGVTIFLFLGALVLVYLSIRKTTKRVWVCFLPLLLFTGFLRGAIYLYHDAFMVFFFALTWYLVVNKSRWKYLAACLLVLTKTQAFLLLIPLAMKDEDWKLLVTFLALMPWYVWGAVENHSFLWLSSHWSNVMNTAFPEWGPVFGTGVGKALWEQRLPVYLLFTLPVLAVARKHYGEVCLLVVALGMYYAWLCIDYHALTMVVVLPIIMATWVDKIFKRDERRLSVY